LRFPIGDEPWDLNVLTRAAKLIENKVFVNTQSGWPKLIATKTNTGVLFLGCVELLTFCRQAKNPEHRID
jgi:hypothetical protein